MERLARQTIVAGKHRTISLREHPSGSRPHKSHKSSHELPRAHKEVSKPKSHRDSKHAELPKETVAKPLSGDNDYVRKWLAHTDSLTNQHLSSIKALEMNSNEGGMQPTDVKPKTSRQKTEEGQPPIRKRKHRHSSSDSSILAEVIRPKLRHLDKGNEETEGREKREILSHDFRKKQKLQLSESNSWELFLDDGPPKETFERRARNKTREDKYEPKTGVQKLKKDGSERKSRRKTEKSNRRKAPKKSGEDLMKNFSSKSIGQERLTIRPPQGLGLFNNGRASSPTRRRGLSDLAFSEMNFLQHSNRQPQVEQKNKIGSKTREKEKRKVARAQEEITEFFIASRKPLESTHFTRRRQASSSRSAEKSSIYVRQVEQENLHQIRGGIGSLSRERPLIGLRHQDSCVDRLSTCRSVSRAITDPRKDYRSVGERSEKANTYISWSETQLSPAATSHHQPSIDQERLSPTPESVWKSIQETGIFKDTGIEKIIGVADRRERLTPRAHPMKMASHRLNSAYDVEMRKPKSGPTNSRLRSRREARFQYESQKSHGLKRRSPTQESQLPPEKSIGAEEDESVHGVASIRRRVIVEHFDAEHGWHESPNPMTRSASDIPRVSESTPVTRQELAKAARIKRPSTTLPITRIEVQPHDELPVNQANSLLARTDSRDHESSISVNDLSNSNKNQVGVNAPFTNSEQEARQDKISQEPPSERDRQRSTSRSGSVVHNPDGIALEVTRSSSKVDALQDLSQNAGISTYLGLPVRGSRNSLHTSQHRRQTSVLDLPPYFLRQMKHEEPLQHEEVATYHEVNNYEIYNIQEGLEPRSGSKDYQTYNPNEDYLPEDSLRDDYGQDMDVELYDYDNVDEIGTVYHSVCNEYEDMETHDPPRDDREIMYENDATVEEEFSQELEVPFQVSEQDGYEFQDAGLYDHMQGLWRPQMQY